jgi:hypothetical protein
MTEMRMIQGQPKTKTNLLMAARASLISVLDIFSPAPESTSMSRWLRNKLLPIVPSVSNACIKE